MHETNSQRPFFLTEGKFIGKRWAQRTRPSVSGRDRYTDDTSAAHNDSCWKLAAKIILKHAIFLPTTQPNYGMVVVISIQTQGARILKVDRQTRVTATEKFDVTSMAQTFFKATFLWQASFKTRIAATQINKKITADAESDLFEVGSIPSNQAILLSVCLRAQERSSNTANSGAATRTSVPQDVLDSSGAQFSGLRFTNFGKRFPVRNWKPKITCSFHF